MTVDVRQRQYAIGLRGTDSRILVTENISTCTGLAGIDAGNGVVFLFHFDLLLSSSSLKLALEELKKHVKDLKGFQLYMVAGISPRVMGSLFVFTAVLLTMHLWVFGFMSLLLISVFSFTRLHLRYILWKSKEFNLKPVWFAHTTSKFGVGLTGVRVDADSGQAPEAYSHDSKCDRFEVVKEQKWWDFKISKAPDSA